MIKYYSYHGINLRTCYESFDRHHKGTITESQFYRSFPGPPDVSTHEMTLLVMKYRDPENFGLLNYLNLHHDLVAMMEKRSRPLSTIRQLENISNYMPTSAGGNDDMQTILNKIKVACFKNGIRTHEYFKDHDKLRHGEITENQFICGLSLAAGKEAQLSRAEIQKTCEYYKTSTGRVNYKEFCDAMENAFNTPDLVKKPTQTAERPPRGALSRGLNNLTSEEKKRCEAVLETLSSEVRKRRLMIHNYFRDYDRGCGYTRLVTKSQFRRILHFFSLNVNSEDFKVLAKMFEEEKTKDINYPAFVQAIDSEFTGFIIDEPVPEKRVNATCSPLPDRFDTSVMAGKSEVSFDDLMARIKHIVLTNRTRSREFFEDFDPLRTGSISKDRFRRSLASLGLNKLQNHDLTDGQFAMLCENYQDPKKRDHVCYKQFTNDLDEVFTQSNLEKTPTHRVVPQETFLVPKPGTVDFNNASDDHRTVYDNAMNRLTKRVNQRRVLLKPVFQDFDKHNNQYVTRPQFRQCLTMLELNCSEAEVAAIEAKFCDDMGFNYKRFQQEIQPEEQENRKYLERLEDLRKLHQRKKLPERGPCTDLEGVLTKIKTKVYKERIRVLDFLKVYDKLNHGRMKKSAFACALDLARLELTESEICILEDKYQDPRYHDEIDYRAFSDEIESVFTKKNLEKSPLISPVQFKPPVEWEQNHLDPETEACLNRCIERVAEKVGKTRMQLFPLFEDYDRVHNGTVSRSQFRRVLSELALGSLVNDQELKTLYDKFDVKIGGQDDVNYIAFCSMIYERANISLCKP
ncbi:uncharacterized protein LOC135492703 isoform X2 [Lineus longissimus]